MGKKGLAGPNRYHFNIILIKGSEAKVITALFCTDTVLRLISNEEKADDLLSPVMDLVIVLDAEARTNKDGTSSDKMRDGLASAGNVVKDGEEGTSWY